MPELKHNFLKGRMNKDLDERLVPDGEYRDALNIEVSTSEDSNVGAVQTVKGNIDLSFLPVMSSTKCVGKILDEKNDKLYWLVSEIGNRPSPAGANPPPVYGDFTVSDVINSLSGTATPEAVVDTTTPAGAMQENMTDYWSTNPLWAGSQGMTSNATVNAAGIPTWVTPAPITGARTGLLDPNAVTATSIGGLFDY